MKRCGHKPKTDGTLNDHGEKPAAQYQDLEPDNESRSEYKSPIVRMMRNSVHLLKSLLTT